MSSTNVVVSSSVITATFNSNGGCARNSRARSIVPDTACLGTLDADPTCSTAHVPGYVAHLISEMVAVSRKERPCIRIGAAILPIAEAAFERIAA